MKRFCAILEKQIPRMLTKSNIEKQLVATYLKQWQGKPLVLKQEWDYLEASAILQSLANKLAIEQAYCLFMDEIEQYWMVLDYSERVRIMNIDLMQCYTALPVFQYEERPCVISFFDQRLNQIYQQEMIVFERKQYQALRKDYRHVIMDLYGTACFDGIFVPTTYVLQEADTAVFYHSQLHKFYLRKDTECLLVPLFDETANPFVLTREQQQTMARLLVQGNKREALQYGVEQGFYSQSCQAAVLRQLDRKKVLGLF